MYYRQTVSTVFAVNTVVSVFSVNIRRLALCVISLPGVVGLSVCHCTACLVYLIVSLAVSTCQCCLIKRVSCGGLEAATAQDYYCLKNIV